jgi:hypothetical protein
MKNTCHHFQKIDLPGHNWPAHQLEKTLHERNPHPYGLRATPKINFGPCSVVQTHAQPRLQPAAVRKSGSPGDTPGSRSASSKLAMLKGVDFSRERAV